MPGGMTRGARWVRHAWLALMAAACLAGCSAKGTLVPNVPPETTLFVQGPVDTVSHTVHLYWFGSDPDGEVVAFELRFRNPAAPADTQWVRTTRSDSIFTVFAPEGYTAPTFEVRAIDNQGAVDPTPAVEDFQFRNQAPTVTLLHRVTPADTTFASLTLTWTGNDPDGGGENLRFRVWLNGNEGAALETTERTITIPSADFLQGGAYASGYRTVYVQPIDAGGRAGAPDSATWFVRAPVTGSRARLLIIDDVPTTNPANRVTDTLFTNTAARNLGAGEYSVLQLQFTQPFRSAKDLEQTCRLFETVLWYRGTELSFPTVLRDYQAGLGAYLENGGKLILEGYDLIEGRQERGALTQDFMQRYLGSERLIYSWSQALLDSVAGWGNVNGAPLRSDMYADSLLMRLFSRDVRAFLVRDPSYVAIYAPPGSLTPSNPIPLPVAVSVPQPSGGRAMLVSFPFRAADLYGNVPRFLAKVFQQFGLTGP